MRAYLDPDLFLFTDAEWKDLKFVDRFSDVIDFLQRIKKKEAESSLIGQSVKLHVSEDIIEHLYSSNPALNNPPRPFYYNQYRSVVMPELLRRATVCAGDSCLPIGTSALDAVPADTGALTNLLFADHLNTCLACTRTDPKCVVRGEKCSIANDNEVFEISAPLASINLDVLIDPLEVLPSGTEANKMARLEQAIASFVAITAISDPQWGSAKISRIEVTDEFWGTYRQAKFPLSHVYGSRLCSVLAQITTGFNVDTNAHGMAPEKFTHNNKSIGKWNAYIFKMGPDAQDNRCSRLYYGFDSGAIILHRYEPDAH